MVLVVLVVLVVLAMVLVVLAMFRCISLPLGHLSNFLLIHLPDADLSSNYTGCCKNLSNDVHEV